MLLALILGSFAGNHASAQEEDKEPLNAISLGGAYVYQMESEEGQHATGRAGESLGGFVIRYQRELIPRYLAIGLAKPFYFNRDRFDSPFDVTLKGLLRRGAWEAFLGLILRWNLRFGVERLEHERTTNKMSLGIGAVLGGSYSFTRNWGIEVEGLYEYIPSDDIIEHEFGLALSGVFRF